MGPGVLWVAALLASLLSLPRLFASDYADGTLEQIALSPYPLPALVSGKIARALADDRPAGRRAGAAPRTAVRARRRGAGRRWRLALLIGTPILSLLGAIGAALTLGAARRRQPARAAGAAAVRAGADLRRGRGGRACAPACRRRRQPVAARRRACWSRSSARRSPPRPPCASRSTDEPLSTSPRPPRSIRSPGARALVRLARAALLARRRAVDRLRHRADRLPAGRGVPDHLHPRAGGVDVDVHLPRDGVLERRSRSASTRGCRR